MVVSKPAGLSVQGGSGVGASLDGILAAERPERPLLAHRLDRDTSGLVLLAKGPAAAAAFAALLGSPRRGGAGEGGGAAGGAVKRYLAVCRGRPPEPEGAVRLDLAERGGPKRAETRYRLLEELPCAGGLCLLELELGTGRTHQIRRHMAMIGCPVAGDDRHGDFALNRALKKGLGLRRMLLHASRLVIPRMPDGSRLDVSAPLPEHFERFLAAARA